MMRKTNSIQRCVGAAALSRSLGSAGVTLIEVLATLMLIAIVLPVVLQGATIAMQASSSARHRAEATVLAEARLNQLLAVNNLVDFNGAGVFDQAWSGYRWESSARGMDLGLYELSVTVFWVERGQERSLTLTSLAFPPASMLLEAE